MATYTQLSDLMLDEDLHRRVGIAILVAADTVRTEDPLTANHTERLAWAKLAPSQVDAEVTRFLGIVLGKNKDAPAPANIQTIDDTTIQNQIDQIVNFFAV